MRHQHVCWKQKRQGVYNSFGTFSFTYYILQLHITYLHCLQHSLFEHLFNLYCYIHKWKWNLQMTYLLWYAYLYCVLRHICHIYFIAVLFQMALTELFSQTSIFTLKMRRCQQEIRLTWHNYKETHLTNFSRARFARAFFCLFIFNKNGLLKSKYYTFNLTNADINYAKRYDKTLKFAVPISKCFRRPCS